MWRSRIFWRLFSAYGILLILSFGMLGWVLIGRMERHLLQEIRHGLEIKTLFLRELVNRHDESKLQEQISLLAKETNARITLIRATGEVLADSSEQPAKMENHRDRLEIEQAETSELGVSTRYSGTIHQPMMYVARRNNQGPVRYVRIALPLDAVVAEIRWLHRVVWTAIGITLVSALVLSMVIARRISAPLVRLSGAANSIAQGDYGKKVLISSADEVGALAASFNAMSEACAAQIAQMDRDREQLRAIFRSMVEGVLVLDAEQTILFANEAASQLLGVPLQSAQGQKIWQVFRHRQLNEAIANILASDEPYRCDLEWAASERRALALQGARLPGQPHRGAVLVFHDITHLRKLETVRQDFVANVSHELKTPLAAIQATVETLLDGAMHDPEHNTRFLERIRESGDRLHRLVQDLLSLARIESSQAPLELEPIVLPLAVAACIARHADRAKAKNLHLIAESAQELVTALGDEEALSEILDNLVDNAIKYTPDRGTITLRWFAEGGNAILQVVDTGVGIPEKDLPRIFERFYRVDKARSRELGGTGLGLSIVKHLVHAMGGKIMAASDVGGGSVFSMAVPLAQAETMHRQERLRVVFVCVENSNRSQMAEAFLRIHGNNTVEPFSGGSRPSGLVNPKAIEAMREVGYDLTRHTSKGLAELSAGEFDIAVTMGCGDECPNLRAKRREEWNIPDPKELPPEQFRVVRDLIEQKVKELLRRIQEQSVLPTRNHNPFST
jgi:two-component system phosphate regulon sensor histidine kinase PhoR